MRRLLSLGLMLSGCQLLPIKDVNCADTDRCAAFVSTPFVLGQPDAQTNWLQSGISRGVGGVLLINGKLLVSDSNNNRVLIWNSFPKRNNQPPDQWLGQPDLSVLYNNGADAFQIPYPTRLASNGTQFVVATDTTNYLSNKPLIFWNSIPATSSTPYEFEISPGPNPVAGALTFDGISPFLSSTQLFLSDRTFNRVLVWNAIPTTASMGASSALGQPNLASGVANYSNLTASSLKGPEGSPVSDGKNLYVSDTGNNRVLLYTLPLSATVPVAATMVLGQPGFTASQANRGGAANLGTVNGPTGLALSGTRLAVADRSNNRILLWKTLPTQPGQNADLVLGQPNGTSVAANNGGVSATSLNLPTAVAISADGSQLAVADSNNARVLLWNGWPTSSGTPADLVLGQLTMTNNGFNGEYPTAQLFLRPSAIARADSRFIVADGDGNRILIWSQFPTNGAAQPTLVLGQPNFTSSGSNSGGVSASSLNNPSGVASDGTVLVVADSGNNRVLLWNNLPTQTRQPADVFLGQTTSTMNAVNAGGTKTGLTNPTAVGLAGGRLYVADTTNSRVLIWKSIPTQNQPPDIVLGQSDFTGTAVNRNNLKSDATTLSGPRGVYADDAHIYVSDTGNSRVLIWNSIDPTSGQAADVVLGAPDFVAMGRLYNTLGLQVSHGRLYVTEGGSNRILYWNSIPTQNGLPASGVLGQPNLQTNSANPGGISISGLQSPAGILVTDVGIYIADGGNGRIVAQPPLP